MPKASSKAVPASTLKPFPKPISLKKMIGPSFLILAFGLGSGELILWPYLTSNHGLGIIWAALLGISFQYFIDMEIERYALVKGESVFVGLARRLRFAPYWFILSTFVGFALPGIIAASAQALAAAFGFAEFKWLAIGLLILLGIILSLGRTVYSLMEHLTKTLILIGVPFILLLVLILVDRTSFIAAAQGLIGIGPGYRFLPESISLLTFLGAFAYSGAAGNLNLSQSIYIREKGYGMGVYSQKIAGMFHAGALEQEIKLEGEPFASTPQNRERFQIWWKRMNLEHGLIFWGLGFLAMALLMILSYDSVYGQAGNSQGIFFVINQSIRIGSILGPWSGVALLLVIGVLLLQTQLGILDSTSRMISENVALKKQQKSGHARVNLTRIYYICIWAQVAFGVFMLALGFEPRALIVAGAVANAWAMIVHIALVYYLNQRELAPEFRPVLWRRIVIGIIFVAFLGFGLLTIWSMF